MSNTIKIKRGSGIPDSLVEGELAIDTLTGRLYSLVGGVVTELNEPPEDVDLSDYINTTKRNDVVEGTFQILWDDSADPTYPFNGRIGYNKAVSDPNALDGSFLYVSGTRGTFSIGRDGDLELHGASELQGIPNNNDERPWITGFSYVQAADFLDADGNSIVGAGGDDLWVVSDPNEFGQRRASFPDQISNPDDIYDFCIRYSTDPEQGTISRALINAYKFYVKDIEATGSIESDSVETREVVAAAVEAGASIALEQVVVGGIVVGDAVIKSSFSEEQQAEAMGLQSALKVIKPMPDPIPNKVTVDIDKDGSITAAGAVQAADFLDADGNSIIGGGDPEWANNDKENLSIALGWNNTPSPGHAHQVLLGSGISAKALSIAIGGEAEAETQAVTVGFATSAADFGVAIGMDSSAGYQGIALGRAASSGEKEFAISGDINTVNFSGATLQAQDFLDGEGNSIIGGDVDLDWVNNEENSNTISLGWGNIPDGSDQIVIGKQATSKSESIAIGKGAQAGSEAVVVGGADSSAEYAGTAIGYNANAGENSIALGSYVVAKDFEFAIGGQIKTVNFSRATLQAQDFLDGEGNSIVGGGVDLTGYATEAYVGEEIAKIPAPPPAPVTSVNSMTGNVLLDYSDVGAKPSSYKAPVDSVNGKTGAVSLSASDVGALPTSYTPPPTTNMFAGSVGIVIGSSYGFGGSQPYLMPCNEALTYINTGMMGNGQSTQWSVMYSASFYKNGSPTMSAVDLIDTFTTIKSAITEESTVEGLRTSVINGLDAVLAKLQAMEDKAEEEGHKA